MKKNMKKAIKLGKTMKEVRISSLEKMVLVNGTLL